MLSIAIIDCGHCHRFSSVHLSAGRIISMKKLEKGILAAFLSLTGWSQVQADMAADTPSATDQGLQEIVVTAQRRSESIEKTPVAITAVTGEALANEGVMN